MSEFGNLLRNFREGCKDPLFPARRLSQARFGQLLGNEFGIQSYSGAAVSDWEHGKSKIHADDRLVLVALINVLHEGGGLKTVEQANELLEAGNYRALNPGETKILFPKNILDKPSPPPERIESEQGVERENFFFGFSQEFQAMVVKEEEGPSPYWPRVMVALFRGFSDHLSAFSILTFILWIWVWLLACVLILPSLRWPFSSRDDASVSLSAYAFGTVIIPALIGALTNTKDNKFWQEKESVGELNLRLYSHQGASIGFHLGFFLIFIISLLSYSSGFHPPIWIELGIVLIPLLLGYAGARLIPYNLLQAYGRLSLRDGMVFFVFFLLGPASGYFFFELYPILLTRSLGVLIILLAVTILLAMITLRYRQTGTTVIPVYWWLIFFGSIVLCQFLVLLIK